MKSDTDLSAVGLLLAGAAPAVIRETVERAKLATIMRTGKPGSMIEAADLEISAQAMKEQQELLAVRVEDTYEPSRPIIEAIADEMEARQHGGLARDIRNVRTGLRKIGVSK